MKLAEALMIRADYQRRSQELWQRLNSVALVQEGENPAENPQELLTAYEALSADMAALVQKINRTNHRVELGEGFTLGDALATREMYLQRARLYANVSDNATPRQSHYSHSPIKMQGTIDVPVVRQLADEASRAARQLDARIQEANWTNDLIE